MNFSAKFLIKILINSGFEYRRSKGSHQVYFNKSTNKTVIVPLHGNKDLPRGTFLTILEQAGIDKKAL